MNKGKVLLNLTLASLRNSSFYRCANCAFSRVQLFCKFIHTFFKNINILRMTITILGGGIAGLSSAFYLATRNNIPKICLYEASSRVSGWINSERHDGYFFESSARTLRPKGLTGNTALELIELLGLENKVVPIKSDRVAGKFRLTITNNRFCEISPESDNQLKGLFGSEGPDTESIYDYAVRKFNKELADYVISPMVSGICAGDAREISASFLAKSSRSASFEQVELYKKARNERWNFYSLQGGLETLPKAILESLSRNSEVALNLNSSCKKIHFDGDGTAKVTINEEVHTATHLISALPSYRLAPLLKDQHPILANELSQLKSYDSVTVNLHFPSDNLNKQKGFGVFIPPLENSPILGITFDSSFVDMKGTTLTVILGGKDFEKHFGKNPDEKKLFETSLKQVKDILGISDEPDNYKVNIMRNSFPQYTVGHYARLERIKDYIKSNKLPLSLCGQSYDGIGINEVILSAKVAANSI